MSNQGFDPMKSLNTLRDQVREGMNRLLEDGMAIVSGSQTLPIDVYETENSVIIKAGPIVGVQPENIDVSFVGETLTIKGETVADDADGSYLRRERKYGAFTRSVAIPRPVKAEQAAASFKDSILTITLPKAEDTQPKVINVKQVDSRVIGLLIASDSSC